MMTRSTVLTSIPLAAISVVMRIGTFWFLNMPMAFVRADWVRNECRTADWMSRFCKYLQIRCALLHESRNYSQELVKTMISLPLNILSKCTKLISFTCSGVSKYRKVTDWAFSIAL